MIDDPKQLLLHNGRIYPAAGADRPAQAILIGGERVNWLGKDQQAGSVEAQRIDLAGRTVLPGLVDAHIHLEKYARQLDLLDCELPSKQACLEAVAARAARVPAGDWLLGHGWNQNSWEGFGTAAELDRAAPDHPVYLTAKSLHAGWANSDALRMAGIDSNSSDPEGGLIQRSQAGAPTGILFEKAMRLVSKLIPDPEPHALADRLDAAQQRLTELGLTGIHDFDGPRCLAALQILRRRGRLRLRVIKNVLVEALAATQAAGLRSGFGDDWIRLGSVKAFADGALGPRTAAMLSAFEDDPKNHGVLLLDREAVSELGIQAAEAGFGLTVHAIGDRANHEVLDGFATLRTYEAEHNLPSRRHRIEHLQLLHPEDVRRPAELGLVASMQPIHATSDMRTAALAWADRSRFAYGWRSQIEAGARLAFGSDAPVEDPNPFLGIHSALTRQTISAESPAWIPQERISLAEALGAYSEGPAYAAGTDDRQGRLQPGYLADLIVLESDPRELEPEQIAGLSPIGVMVGGEWQLREF